MNFFKEKQKGEGENHAFIDGANLYEGTKHLNWDFDYKRFRVWLKEKYGVTHAYLFLGLVPKYKNLYKHLQDEGFILIFKEITYDINGKVKGNCDADIVLQVVQGVYENSYNKAVLVSSDGDYASMVSFLIKKEKMCVILSPYESKKCSMLLKRTGVKIAYISDQKSILQTIKEKAPDEDETS